MLELEKENGWKPKIGDEVYYDFHGYGNATHATLVKASASAGWYQVNPTPPKKHGRLVDVHSRHLFPTTEHNRRLVRYNELGCTAAADINPDDLLEYIELRKAFKAREP